MKSTTFIAAAFLSFLLESKLTVFGIRPDLTMLLSCYIGFKDGPGSGLKKGAVLGLIGDGLSGRMLGPGMFGSAVAGFLAGYLAGPIGTKPAVGYFAICFLSALGGAISFGSLSAFGDAPIAAGMAAYIILTQALLNSLSAPFIRPNENRYY